MASSAKSFQYEAKHIEALELSLSSERLRPYILRAGGSRLRAILIYERNTALSEALYGVTQAAEVALRNAIHRVLSVVYGQMWFYKVGLEGPQSEKVSKAEFEISNDCRTVTPSAIVAELNLGFWTSLISTRYEKVLWVPHLHKAFPFAVVEKRERDGSMSSVKLTRAEIFEQLERIRTLWNRIAHHEPILKLGLDGLYSQTLNALKWICPVSAEWVRATNCFPQRFHEKPLSYAAPKLAPPPQVPRPGMPRS